MFKIYFLIMCMCVCPRVGMYMNAGTCGGQRRQILRNWSYKQP